MSRAIKGVPITFYKAPKLKTKIGLKIKDSRSLFRRYIMRPHLLTLFVAIALASGGSIFYLSSQSGVHAITPPATLGALSYQKYQTIQLTDQSSVLVNVANGNVLLETTDLNIPGTGPGFDAVRYFNEMGTTAGLLGTANTLSVGPDVKIVANANGSATYQGPSGFNVTFASNGSGGYTSPAAYTEAKLATVSGGGWTLTFNQTGEVYTFNAAGQQIKDSDKNGVATNYTYTSGKLTSATDAQGRTITFANYSGNNVGKITDPSGRYVQYAYTSGRLTGVTDVMGNTWAYQYSTSNQLTQITDPRGYITKINYDSSNRVSSIVLNYNLSSAVTYSYAYNNTNAQTVVTDPLTHNTAYTYDSTGRVLSTQNAVGDVNSTAWDSSNNQQSSTSASNYTTAYTHDATTNNLTKIQNPSLANGTVGASTSFAYTDTAHPYLPSSSTDAQGNISSFSYDTSGNVTAATGTSVMNTTQHIQGDPVTPGASAWNCDGFNGQVCRTYTDSSNILYLYDGNGNIQQTDQQEGSANVYKNFTTDSLSRLKTYTDGNGSKVTYTYDSYNRVTDALYANDGRHYQYTYDKDGNLTQVAGSDSGTTNYTYDSLNRITQVSQQQGPGSSTYKNLTYTYDKANNLKTEQGDAGTVTYTYDNANQVTGVHQSVSNSDYTIAYTAGRPTTITIPGGITETMTYDRAGREISIKAMKGATVLTNYSATYVNAAGADTELMQTETDNVAGTVTTYGYDSLNRLTSAVQSGGANPHSWSYTYDNDGNRTSATTDGSTVNFGYTGEELTSYNDGNGSTEAATYDSEGNALTYEYGDGLGTDTYTYNAENQVSSITPNGNDTFNLTYVDSGQNGRTSYGSSSYANGLMGLYKDARGSTTVYFTHLPSGTAQTIGQQIGTNTYYYLQDLHGSTVAMTDGSGNVKDTFAYDPYGETTDSNVTVYDPIQFQNAYYEGLSGLYFMGDRYYNPGQGRFTQVDPSGKDFYYIFAADNPVNFSDPSGNSACSDAYEGIAVSALAFGGGAISLLSSTVDGPVGIGVGLATIGSGVELLNSSNNAYNNCQ